MERHADETSATWWPGGSSGGRSWVIAWCLWTGFSFLMAGHAELRFDQGRSYLEWLGTMLPFYWAWVPLTAPLAVLLGRCDVFTGPRGRAALTLIGAALAAAAAHGLLYTLFLLLREGGDVIEVGLRTYRRHGMGDLATFGALAAIILIGQQYRRAERREREAAREAIRASRLEAQLAAAKLDALQMQLRPHFLFNALNGISVLVLKGASREAIRGIRQLGALLRATLNAGGADELPLAEEMRFVEGYLELERLRFADRLQVELDVPAEPAGAMVPRLILQPLIENAVIHGLASRDGGGRIRVTASRQDDTLQLDVSDNGSGLSTDTTPREGVGLSNVRARLHELYGSEAGLRVRPAAGGGTVASISLPFHVANGCQA